MAFERKPPKSASTRAPKPQPIIEDAYEEFWVSVERDFYDKSDQGELEQRKVVPGSAYGDFLNQ
jgi:hypothetical protein